MNDFDGLVHHHVISSFVRRGHAPSVEEIAAEAALERGEVEAALKRLHDGHGLVLHPGALEVWLAHPFSSSPANVFVAASERGWWAPCLWCAMGVVAIAAPNATIHARWGGEQDEARIEVRDGAPISNAFVHFAIPPRDAWQNVVHWCAAVQPFRSEAEIAPWCERHRIPKGVAIPIAQVAELGQAWYGKHLDRDWKKHSITEAQAIFERVGLRGDFWRLPTSDKPF
jgi:hypothetical protein